MPNTLYLIDTMSLIFQVFHAIPEMTGPRGSSKLARRRIPVGANDPQRL